MDECLGAHLGPNQSPGAWANTIWGITYAPIHEYKEPGAMDLKCTFGQNDGPRATYKETN